MRHLRLLFGAMISLLMLQPFVPAQAASTYHVSVDSSSLFGNSGFLDLQFNPGDVSAPAATALLSDFAGDATLAPGATVDGSVSGTLPAPLLFGNGAPFDAVLQPVTFGNGFAFTISFDGAYQTTPTGSGTRFSLALLDPNYSPLATVDPAGTVLQFELVPGGEVDPVTFDADTHGARSIVALNAVPVPAALPLLASGLAVLGLIRRRSKC